MSPEAKYKVLVANRGEIAIRVLRTARESGWSSVALYTKNDTSHATFADEAVRLDSPSDYMNVEAIVGAAVRTQCTHLHPGYGFLSESPLLPEALEKHNITFIGPSPDVLRISSDKILSRELAYSLDVPIAPGKRIQTVEEIKSFARESAGYPIIIKALDGGGGRGIRVVDREEGIEEAFKRCLGESPSRQLFVEKALTGPGWKHVEVQVIGDGTGAVNHFWERECSVQRRFQKLIETAPSLLPRSSLSPLLTAALKPASHMRYKGLGTFEFLVDTASPCPAPSWVFLEINPRVQVEHTVTEEITGVNLVDLQFRLFAFPPATLSSLALLNPPTLPNSYAIQLRLTAEDPEKSFFLSMGTVSRVSLPGGRGVRVDTWLSSSPNDEEDGDGWEVSANFDSLLAKIIVYDKTWDSACRLAERALGEVKVKGVKTNLSVLKGVVKHPEWRAGGVDALWLERRLGDVLNLGSGQPKAVRGLDRGKGKEDRLLPASGEGLLLQPGSMFSLLLTPSSSSGSQTQEQKHTLTLQSLTTNAFPSSLSGTLASSFSSSPYSFSLSLSSSAISSTELADPRNPTHIPAPMSGKVVELHPSFSSLEGGGRVRVRKGDMLVVLSMMKMESVLSSPRDGWVVIVGKGVKVGEVVGEGGLVCVLEMEEVGRSRL